LCSTLFPFTTLFRSLFLRGWCAKISYLRKFSDCCSHPRRILCSDGRGDSRYVDERNAVDFPKRNICYCLPFRRNYLSDLRCAGRSEEHTSELQSREN